MIQLDQATRYELSERFEPYITHDLPQQISFLTLHSLGQMCLLNLNCADAISVFNRALILVPDEDQQKSLGVSTLYTALAAAHLGLKQNTEGLDANQKALQFAPDDILIHLQRATLQAAAGQREDSLHTMQEVLEKADAIIESSTGQSVGVSQLREFLATGDPSDLVKNLKSRNQFFKEWREQNINSGRFKRDVVTHVKNASVQLLASDYAGVVRSTFQALRINPLTVPALILREGAYSLLGDGDQAIADLDKAESLDPENAAIFFTKAGHYEGVGQDANLGIGQLQAAFNLGLPKHLAVIPWAIFLLNLGQTDQALQVVKDYAIDPEDPEIFFVRARAFRLRGTLSLALEEAEKAISKIDVDETGIGIQAEFYAERAEIHELMGNRLGALSDFERAIERLPTSWLKQRFSSRLTEVERNA